MHRKFTKVIVIMALIVFIAFVVFKVFDIKNIVFRNVYRQAYSEYVSKYAEKYDIDEMWIYAIIKVESNFNQNAKSYSGAKGLMQLMDNTASELAIRCGIEEFEISMLYEPEINIMLGAKYFDELLTRYDENYYLAIAAYNAGIGNVDNWIEKGIISSDGSNIENIPYRETNMYVRKTINTYSMYNELYRTK